jgi:hypothetical protein
VATPHSTTGEIVRVQWIAPGAHPLVPSRHLPGHWLAAVAEDVGAAEPGELPDDASELREGEVTPATHR